MGDFELAHTRVERALSLFRALGHARGTAGALTFLGIDALLQHNYPAARSFLEEALEIDPPMREAGQLVMITRNLGQLALEEGNLDEATSRLTESLEIARSHELLLASTDGLELLALVAADRGGAHAAVRVLGAAAALRDALGTPRTTHQETLVRRHGEPMRTLSEADYAAAWDAGYVLPLDQAIDYAIQQAR